jgi:myosin heavy subunit
MDSENNKSVIYIGIAVIILLLISTGAFMIQNSKNKRNLQAEKLRTESLLSEKLLVEKELAKVKADMAACQALKDETEKKLTAIEASIAEKDKRIAYLSNQSGALSKTRKELEELQKTKAELDNTYTALKSEHDKMLGISNDLKAAVAKLESEKAELASKMQQTELYNTDNFRIYGSRGKNKEKLTFWAFRTKKLNLNFDVPQNLTDAISFKLTTPTGSTVNPETAELSWKVLDNPRNFTASLSPVTGEFEPSRQVVLTYAPKEKMEKGEYKIQIFSNSVNIGNCRVRLK